LDEAFIQKLKNADVDVESVEKRFMGKQDLVLRFMKRFPEDENYRLLVASMEEGAYDEAFRACHTLKGLCANLSLTKLEPVVSRQTELLRAEKWEEAKAAMPEVIQAYETALEKLAPILDME
jgi:HPt (histidine-containing phosphotransfer) domain-containing protein